MPRMLVLLCASLALVAVACDRGAPAPTATPAADIVMSKFMQTEGDPSGERRWYALQVTQGEQHRSAWVSFECYEAAAKDTPLPAACGQPEWSSPDRQGLPTTPRPVTPASSR